MDKKSIVNDIYQAAVISVLAVGYSMLGKKILKMTPPSIQKFDLEDTGCYRSCIRDDQRISHKTEDLARSYKHIKMASTAMLIGGALANALAFTGGSYLFHRLSADNINTERKRHNAAIEALQKAQIEWLISTKSELISLINNSG